MIETSHLSALMTEILKILSQLCIVLLKKHMESMSSMNKASYKTKFYKCLNVRGKKGRARGGKKGRRGGRMVRVRSVARTAFSYSRSELLTEAGLKQNQSKGRKTNVLYFAIYCWRVGPIPPWRKSSPLKIKELRSVWNWSRQQGLPCQRGHREVSLLPEPSHREPLGPRSSIAPRPGSSTGTETLLCRQLAVESLTAGHTARSSPPADTLETHAYPSSWKLMVCGHELRVWEPARSWERSSVLLAQPGRTELWVCSEQPRGSLPEQEG